MATPDYSFQFGKFNYICNNVMLTLCPLVGTDDGIEPVCYSRNVRLVDTLIFQPCKSLLLLWLFYLRHCCNRGGHFLFGFSCVQSIWHSITTLMPKVTGTERRQDKGPHNTDRMTFFLFHLFYYHCSRRIIATLIIHLIALIMTAIMIYHIRSKYTAVGKHPLHPIDSQDNKHCSRMSHGKGIQTEREFLRGEGRRRWISDESRCQLMKEEK